MSRWITGGSCWKWCWRWRSWASWAACWRRAEVGVGWGRRVGLRLVVLDMLLVLVLGNLGLLQKLRLLLDEQLGKGLLNLIWIPRHLLLDL